MLLKAGVLSLVLLLASRLLGLARESALAASFGTSGLADAVVLMLTLPDWIVGVLVSGALAYVLVPAWAAQSAAQVRSSERKVTRWLLSGAVVAGMVLLALREPVVHWLAGGLPGVLLPAGLRALAWSAVALPAAVVAAVWTTRLQHERDFAGMYSANLVVNALLIAAISSSAGMSPTRAIHWIGAGLLAAMAARLVWLRWRTPAPGVNGTAALNTGGGLPRTSVWVWAALSAGLPLALPFTARSIASQAGAGGLATFNYAWKLIELPLLLAIQLVATLALPGIAKALANADALASRTAIRGAFALAWALACAAAAALLVGAPAIAHLLFGWGRMEPEALARVAHWGSLGAWSLLPQAVIAVALAVLAGRARMKAAVLAYGLALALLLFAGASGWTDGAALMLLLDVLLGLVALAVMSALGGEARTWMPWRSMGISLGCLLLVAGVSAGAWPPGSWGLWPALAVAALAGLLVVAATWWGSVDLRSALAR